MDHIDRMIVIEVLQIRKEANEARQRLGLPQRDYTNLRIFHKLQESRSQK